MSRFLRYAAVLTTAPLALATLSTGCGDDTTTTQTTTSSSSSGMGGNPVTSTTTSSTGGTGGVGGTGGTGGTGGSPPVACMGPDTGTDTCDGEAINLTLGTDLTLCGDLTNATNDYQDPYCPAASAGPDNVYNVNVMDSGTLKVRVRRDVDSDLNPTTYFRVPNSCTDQTLGASGGCFDFFDEFEDICDDWDAAFLPGFHLFVDGGLDANNMPTTGEYVVEMSLEAAACGDGVYNLFTTTEQCDDGNNLPGDGCSPTCEIEQNTLFDLCAGEPLFPGGNMAYQGSANTTGNADDYSPDPVGSCQGVPTGGRDRVYRITPTVSGMLTATVGLGPDCQTSICEVEGSCSPGCWDYVLWATDATGCGNPLNQIACSDNELRGPESITFPVTASTDYHLIVDGYDDFQFGAFNLCIDIVTQ